MAKEPKIAKAAKAVVEVAAVGLAGMTVATGLMPAAAQNDMLITAVNRVAGLLTDVNNQNDSLKMGQKQQFKSGDQGPSDDNSSTPRPW